MKLVLVLVMMSGAVACDSGARGPAPMVAANACPAPELTCKDAVEKAGAAAHADGRDVAMAIGECEQQTWSMQARKCVAEAHANADLVACAGKYDFAKHGIFASAAMTDKAMAAMTGFRDEMCACKDTACAQHVADEMQKWGEEEAQNYDSSQKMTEEMTRRFTEIGEQMGKCMQKAMGGTP